MSYFQNNDRGNGDNDSRRLHWHEDYSMRSITFECERRRNMSAIFISVMNKLYMMISPYEKCVHLNSSRERYFRENLPTFQSDLVAAKE